MKITNQILLDDRAGVYCIEIFNDLEREPVYEYYIHVPGRALSLSFGVPVSGRFSDSLIIDMFYEGYFDSELEDDD